MDETQQHIAVISERLENIRECKKALFQEIQEDRHIIEKANDHIRMLNAMMADFTNIEESLKRKMYHE